MVSDKKRRRALARAKFERQQRRRTEQAHRDHTARIVLGTAAGVLLLVFAGWGVYHLLSDDGSTSPGDTSLTDFPSNTLTMKTPSGSFFTSYSSPSTTDTSGKTATSPADTPTTTGTSTP